MSTWLETVTSSTLPVRQENGAEPLRSHVMVTSGSGTAVITDRICVSIALLSVERLATEPHRDPSRAPSDTALLVNTRRPISKQPEYEEKHRQQDECELNERLAPGMVRTGPPQAVRG